MSSVKKRTWWFVLPLLVMALMLLCFNFDADAKTGTWKKDKGGWYYSYGGKSYAKNAWVKTGGKWYYCNAKGYMVKGWKKIKNKWYHFAASGAMQTGWKKISGKWYHFTAGGEMQTGWKKLGGRWYHFTVNGDMQTGWKKISGNWYYFMSDGSMVTGKATIGNKSYEFDKNGAWVSDSSKLKMAKVGDVVTFGKYEQDNNKSNGKEDISWLVIDKKSDGSVLLMSRYVIDCKPYNSTDSSVSWKTCSLRSWLNGSFYNTAFRSNEAAVILNTKHSDQDDWSDKVFLLNFDESIKYFGEPHRASGLEVPRNEKYATRPTAYAIAQGCDTFRSDGNFFEDYEVTYKGCANFWFRTDDMSGSAAIVSSMGSVYTGSGHLDTVRPNYEGIGVRPAIWIKP